MPATETPTAVVTSTTRINFLRTLLFAIAAIESGFLGELSLCQKRIIGATLQGVPSASRSRRPAN